jgi:peptide/nickel transport system ATP-binding protein
MMASDPILRVRNLKAHFKTNYFGVHREVPAVDDISFDIERNEIFGLAGESSSGKTTLMKTIAGLIAPPLELIGGQAQFSFMPQKTNLYNADPLLLAKIRWRHLSYIMQGSMNVLNPLRKIRSIFDDFAHVHLSRAGGDIEQKIIGHLARLRLEPSVLDAFVHELSGGMRQRITIALATICRPDFIIADEPTTALDVIVQKNVLGMIRTIQREMGSSVLFVTHDMGVHAALTDRLGIMYAGCLIEIGRTQEIFENPRHPYTRHLIQSLPRIGDTVQRSGLSGTPPNLADPPSGCRFHPRCPMVSQICREQRPVMQQIADSHHAACHAISGTPA